MSPGGTLTQLLLTIPPLPSTSFGTMAVATAAAPTVCAESGVYNVWLIHFFLALSLSPFLPSSLSCSCTLRPACILTQLCTPRAILTTSWWIEGAKTCQVVTPFGPATPTNMSNNGMCPHLGYNFTSTAFGGPNIALTYYAESEDGISWVKPNLGTALVTEQPKKKKNGGYQVRMVRTPSAWSSYDPVSMVLMRSHSFCLMHAVRLTRVRAPIWWRHPLHPI